MHWVEYIIKTSILNYTITQTLYLQTNPLFQFPATLLAALKDFGVVIFKLKSPLVSPCATRQRGPIIG